jgi:hypothetical protein
VAGSPKSAEKRGMAAAMAIRSIANDADATVYKTMYESLSGLADAKIVRVL